MIVITAPTGTHRSSSPRERPVQQRARPRDRARPFLRIPEQIRKRVEVVQGSHGDANVLSRAFAGADSVFWLVPPDPLAKSVASAYLDFTRPACDAIKNQQVKRVVDITALGRGTAVAGTAGHATASLAMDDLIASTGVNFRAVTNPSFMDNVLMQLTSIKTKGVFFSPIDGDRKLPSCATRDIAAVVAKLLVEPSWSGQDHVAVLGPEDLSFNDMAQIMSEVLGKSVRFQQIPLEAYKSRFIELGMSDAMAQAMTDMAAAKNSGLDSAEPRSAKSTTPTGFRQWCEEVLKPAVLS